MPKAVCREIALWRAGQGIRVLKDARVDTVYFGGGTPSLLDPAALAGILDDPVLAPIAGFELPKSPWKPILKRSRRKRLLRGSAAGFNRVSLGAQSFD